MTTHDAFQLAYRSLEHQMKVRAEADGDIFLPSVPPAGPVDYVLICMEPSLGRWAALADQANERIKPAFNFISSIEDFILHFSARKYLCGPEQRYHITDLSKGAMLVDKAHAGKARAQRYVGWYPLLMDEIDLVAKPNAGFIAVGAVVKRLLERQGFRRPLIKVIHFSGQAGRARSASIAGREGNVPLAVEQRLREAAS